MTYILAAGLLFGLSIATPVTDVEHESRIVHDGGPVDVRYRGVVTINHKQIGSVAPGGRTSSLRCVWRAGMDVKREARAASGTLVARQFVREDVASGSRVGWCTTSKAAIAKEVAARTRDLDRHIQQVALEDHDVLRVELDRLQGAVVAG